MASTGACHVPDRGSIPRERAFFAFYFHTSTSESVFIVVVWVLRLRSYAPPIIGHVVVDLLFHVRVEIEHVLHLLMFVC